MGGTNAHVVLKAPPAITRPQADPEAIHRFQVSARDEPSLRERLSLLADWVMTHDPDPQDVCLSLARARQYPVSREMVGTLAQFLDWCEAGGPSTLNAIEQPSCRHIDARCVPLPGHPRHPKRFWPLDALDSAANELPVHPDGQDASDAVLRYVAHFLQVPQVSAQDDLRELGMDSIDMFQLLGELGHDFGIKVPLQVLIAEPTVATVLAEHTRSPQSHRQPSGQAMQPDAALVSGIWQPVRSGARGDLVMVHPAGGTTGCYLSMAQRSHADWSWHAIGSVPSGEASIREMASAYADLAIDRGLSEGAILGGYSMGGNVAVEMAIQLSRRGVQISRLLLLDSYAPETYLAPREVGDYLEAFAMLIPTLIPQLSGASMTDAHSVRGVLDAMTREIGAEPLPENRIQQIEDFYQTWRGHHAALERWVPDHPVDIPITLMRGTTTNHPILKLLDVRPGDGSKWGRHTTAEFTVVDTVGDHFSLVQDERHLDSLTRQIDAFLLGSLAQGGHHG